jgi:UDP-N-acetyl-D-glucosamine dehydrogenase
LVLGLSYKADIDDDRESPSYALLDLLARAGAVVAYADPYFARTKRTRKYHFELHSVAIDADTFAGFDAIVVATEHKEFKQRALFEHARIVVDCRNLIAEIGDVSAGCTWVKA